MDDRTLSRRRLLTAGAFTATGLLLTGAPALAATPECHDGDEPTVRQTEGPYFKPRSPERRDLRQSGMAGVPVELTGVVLTRSCRPVGRALVDLWQADDAGEYDNTGFRLRGHQFTDANGRYTFRTVRPGQYPGRTRHFHVKVQAPGGRVLTTQFYFPNEPENRRDGLFRRELLLRVADTGEGLSARFDVVLDLK